MNEQERQELERNGGIARTEGPDANGITTYHAPNGYFVRIGPDGAPRMRGQAAPENNTATPSQQAPVATSGGGMNQQQIEQWIAANGGAAGLQYNSASRRIRNPARMATNADGSDNPNYDPTAPEWIDVAEESWTNSRTGATLKVSRRPDNSFDVIENKSADPNKPQPSSTTKPAIPPGGSSSTEGTPIKDANGNTTGWDNTRPRAVIKDAQNNIIWSEELTGAELNAWRQQQAQTGEKREPVQGRPGWTSVTRTVTHAGNTKTETVYVGPDGKEVPTLPTDPADRVGKPTGNTRTVQNNGVTVKETEYLLPDGTKEWRSQTETTQPDRIGKPTGNTRQRNENGQSIKEIEYVLPDGTKEWRSQRETTDFAIPPNAPKYTPDYDQDDLGLTAYNAQLVQAEAAGVINREQARRLLEQAGGLATQTASHGTTLRGQRATQRSQDITQRSQDIGEVASRRTFAGDGFDTLYTDFTGNAKHLGRGGGGDAARAFREALFLRQQYAAAHGGFQDVPREPLSPAIQAVRTTRVLPDGSVEIQNPQTPAGAQTPPNAIGVGSVGAVPAPGGRPAVSAPPPTAGEPGGPPLAPGPVYGDPSTGAGMGPSPVPDAGAPYNPAQASPLTVPAGSPYNHPSGDPGHNPNVPVGQVPAYLQPLQAPQWDPEPMRQQLLAQGFAPEVVDEAIQEELMGVA